MARPRNHDEREAGRRHPAREPAGGLHLRQEGRLPGRWRGAVEPLSGPLIFSPSRRSEEDRRLRTPWVSRHAAGDIRWARSMNVAFYRSKRVRPLTGRGRNRERECERCLCAVERRSPCLRRPHLRSSSCQQARPAPSTSTTPVETASPRTTARSGSIRPATDSPDPVAPGGTVHAEQPDPDGQRTRRHLRGRLQPRPADGWPEHDSGTRCRRSSRGPTPWRASSRRTSRPPRSRRRSPIPTGRRAPAMRRPPTARSR